MSLRVLQLSDCHVSAGAGDDYRGINPRETLERVLEVAAGWRPDLVLATGDLSEDASPASYAYLAGAFATLGAPVMALPGNHDDPGRLRETFSATAVDAPLVLHAEPWRIVLLNSKVEDEVPGRISPQALNVLCTQMEQDDGPLLLALHHQPVPVGSPWIDRYPLLEPEPFLDWVRRAAGLRAVCWGHVHQALECDLGGVPGYAGPSTASNSLPGCERFTPDPSGPACRWFELAPDGALSTGVLSLSATPARE